jgi:hypothetical protein
MTSRHVYDKTVAPDADTDIYFGFLFPATVANLAVAELVDSSYFGWTSSAAFMLETGGAADVSLGGIRLYTGKIFDQVRMRPDERTMASVTS